MMIVDFYVTGGTLPFSASSYIARQADNDLLRGLLRGDFCYVLNTRQIGKSSLMVSTAQRLKAQEVRVALLDLTAIGQNVTVEEWYDGLLSLLAEQLEMSDQLEEFWLENGRLGPMQRWMEALRHIVLVECSQPICLFIDEIDAVRSLPFSTDEFFAAIRECYNRRGRDPLFQRLTFCLLGVATPGDLISDPRISPFNIGNRIVLTDFTATEAAPLAAGLQTDSRHPSAQHKVLNRVLYWTGGHPYLTQRLCQTLAQQPSPLTPSVVDRICRELFLSKQGQQTDDNLAFVRNRLLYKPADLIALMDLYRRLLARDRVSDDATNPLHNTLRLAGIVRVEEGNLRVRNRIYEQVFDREWVLANMPDAELRRQRAAYQRGVLRSALVFGGIALIIAGLLAFALISVDHARNAETRANALTTKVSRLLYRSDMSLIQQEWEGGNTAHLLDLLEETRTNRERNFEWDFWYARCHRSIQTFYSEWATAAVHSAVSARNLLHVAFSPDGRSLAGLTDTGILIVWDVSTGIERYSLVLPARPSARDTPVGISMSMLTYSRDGLSLLVGMAGKLELRDARTGALCRDLRDLPEAPAHLVQEYSARTGTYLVTEGQGGALTVRQPGEAGVALRRTRTRPFHSAGIGGGRIAIDDIEGNVEVFDLATGRPIRCFERIFARSVVALSHDGTRLVALGTDGSISTIEVRTGKILRSFAASSSEVEPYAIRFSPDDRTLIIGYVHSIRVWDIETGEELQTFHEHIGELSNLVLSRDGTYLASACKDGTSKLWNLRSANPCMRLASGHPLWVLHYAPNGNSIAVGSQDGLAVRWDTHTGHPLPSLKGHTARVINAIFSHDGSLLVTASSDKTARLWSADGRPLRLFAGHSSDVNCALFTSDDRHLITISDDRTIRFWDIATGKQTRTLMSHTGAVEAADLSRDGRLLATGGADATAKLWDVESERLLRTFVVPGEIWSLSFSPDGRRIAIANLHDTAQVYEAATGRLVCTLKGHTNWVTAIAFSPDGTRIVTGSRDTTARVWDAETGGELLALRGHRQQVSGVAFSPTGDQIATTGKDGDVRLWNAPRIAP